MYAAAHRATFAKPAAAAAALNTAAWLRQLARNRKSCGNGANGVGIMTGVAA